MERTLTRLMTGVLAWSCAFTTAFAARGVLHADGILSIKGAREGSARVTVMPHDKPAYTLQKGLSRFVLELELDNTFLVTFEQEGCVTKQLYFDTTVPAEHHAGEFFFPFKVTLEDHGHAGAFTYAGPVGFIRYHAEITDFGYDTDYTINVDDSFNERMAVLKSTGTDPRAAMAVPLAATVVTRGYQRPEAAPVEEVVSEGEGTLAPVASEVPPLVHNTGGATNGRSVVAGPAFMPMRKAEVVEEAPIMATAVIAPAAIVPLVIADELTEPALAVAEEPVSEEPEVRIADGAVPALPAGSFGREEELIVEGNRVITIVRLHDPQGHATEYRRVAHRYGAVFFFKDGLSVPEHVYSSGTALGAQNL